jgi:hypothetical protein
VTRVSPLLDFIRESNRIEGILRPPLPDEVVAHEVFLAQRGIEIRHVEAFVDVVANARLRDKRGMDVYVGNHTPPAGGPFIRDALTALLADVQTCDPTPFETHVRYETLHPFMDGNGRSGRVLWAWQMRRDGHDPFALPFLHRFYYQALDGARR